MFDESVLKACMRGGGAGAAAVGAVDSDTRNEGGAGALGDPAENGGGGFVPE